MFKRIAVGAIGLALPLALAAAPAVAGERHHDDAADPEIAIKDVYAKHGDIYVKVKYECETEDDNGYRKAGHKKDDDATIEVTLTQRHVKYAGDAEPNCDGKERYATIELEREYGHLYTGKAKVTATITDEQGETDTDTEHVKVKVYKHHH